MLCQMLPEFLDCPYLIATSVFTNVFCSLKITVKLVKVRLLRIYQVVTKTMAADLFVLKYFILFTNI